MAEQKKSFVLYNDYIEQIKLLSHEDAGLVFLAILAHENQEELPELTGAALITFSFIRKDLEHNRKKYETQCERNRENGAKGGRPAAGKTQRNPEKPTGYSEKPTKTQENPKEPYMIPEDDNDNEENIPPKSPTGVFEDYSKGDQELLDTLNGYGEMRRKLKKPLTEHAKKLLLKKLDKLAEPYREKRRYRLTCLEDATLNSWQSVYPLKDFEDGPPEPLSEEKARDHPVTIDPKRVSWEDLVP